VGTLRIPVCSSPWPIPKRSLRILPSACLGRPTGTHLGRGTDSRALTQWQLKLHKQEQSGWNADNSFYWRFVFRGGKVPPDTEEHAAVFYERRGYALEKAVFRLLVDYLGHIALRRSKLEEAISHFQKTIELWRKLFLKRIGKKPYWSDLQLALTCEGLAILLLPGIKRGATTNLSLCSEPTFYLRMFVYGAVIHKLSTMPDGIAKAGRVS